MKNKDKIIAAVNNLRWEMGENFHDSLMESLYTEASEIANKSIVLQDRKSKFDLDRFIDRIVTSKIWGFPLMFLILSLVLWVTIEGSNYPSQWLSYLLLDTVHPVLKSFSADIGLVWWLDGLLIDGAYLAMAWVISVMLPPMAIFFPIFTLLEDLGYLPRVAFNLDRFFKAAGAHGKQALTMSMGFGCNAAGVVAARIIDSPRERLIAIITNNFSLCNGRWPTQILIATIFIGALVPSEIAGMAAALSVVAVALLGIVLSLLVSWFLSKSVLKGEASTFTLELPPYRPPRVLQTLYTSLIDRTLIVLWRAIVFAIPAGLVIWSISNISLNDLSLAEHFIFAVDPVAIFIGLNGVIILAYVIAIPANEIVIPTILMLTVLTTGLAELGQGTGVMFEMDSLQDTASILTAGGWTVLTGINVMLFSLIHNPCSTTIYTIYKETGSMKWTIVSAILPLVMGFFVCFVVTQLWRIFS
ncbi:MAG: ferrous iron transporter B [Melioribacteraceae bacterium]|nr:ferrous iron transporter B [Melioribacteraceae bacterium]MCO6474060.1 ferrous iron transporter B [Melioribacteraceae bacterium]